MDGIELLGLIAVFIVLLGLVAMQEDRSKTSVRKLLEEKGFREIIVTMNIATMQRGTLTFDVEYRGKNGELQRNSCVVLATLFSERRIYWEKPID